MGTKEFRILYPIVGETGNSMETENIKLCVPIYRYKFIIS